MTLSEWVAQHPDAVRAQPPRADAVAALWNVVARELRDAESVWSDDGRLEHAFAACLGVAAVALAARGYRLRHGALAHHYLLVSSLEHTLGLSADEVEALDAFRRKRGRARYERVGLVTRTEADSALLTARALRARCADWMAETCPDLATALDDGPAGGDGAPAR